MSTPIVIFNFHGIGDPPRPLEEGEADVWLSRPAFETALDVLAQLPNVAITIDDGNVSDTTIALPELERRGLRAEFFVLAGKLGTPGYLSAGDVRRLAAAGMGVGSHGMQHRPWTAASAEELAHEIVGAKRRLEDVVGQPVERAACPFGAYDRRVLRALRAAAFRRVYTSDRGRAQATAWLQPRFTVHAGDPRAQIASVLASRDGLGRRLWRAAKRFL